MPLQCAASRAATFSVCSARTYSGASWAMLRILRKHAGSCSLSGDRCHLQLLLTRGTPQLHAHDGVRHSALPERLGLCRLLLWRGTDGAGCVALAAAAGASLAVFAWTWTR